MKLSCASNRVYFGFLVALLASAIVVSPGANGATLIPTGAVWKYLDDGSDQGTAWTAVSFNDSTWASGPAQLGYGDGDEATMVGFGPDAANKYITTYFRKAFGVTNASSVTGLVVRLLRDDGGVVYLNGVEVFRSNMPSGPISFNTLAVTAAGGADETTNYYSADIPASLLVSGVNVVAVEIHQNAATSSDLSFDLALVSTASQPPVPPSIITQPQSQTVPAGSDVTFSVEATGTQPLTYQWRKNGETLTIGPDATLTLVNVQSNNAGSYSVVVTNTAGTATSSDAILSVTESGSTNNSANQPPIIGITSPTNGSRFTAPANIIVRASASDSDGVVTQVDFFSGTHRIGVDFSEPYSIVWSNVQAGTYQLRASATDNSNAVAFSSIFNITVGGTNAPVPPTIVQQPQSRTVQAGSDVTFTVQATGTQPLSYRWRRNSLNVPGGTNSSLTLFNVQTNDAGNYSVIVTNIAGSRISSNATLTVITSQPTNAQPITLVSTGAVWKYLDNGSDQGTAWQANGFDDSAWASGPAQLGYGDGDEATVVGSGPDPSSRYIATYFRRSFVLTNVAGISNLVLRLLRDDGAVVYINGIEVSRQNMPAGTITYQTLATVTVGGSEETTTFIQSDVPPGVLVSGLNTVAVEIHQVNPTSSDISFDLELVANAGPPPPPPPTPPTIVSQPQSQTVNAGSDVTFNVGATGSPPLSYRWRKNGVIIPGATSSNLTLLNVQSTNAGLYSVIVSNSAGSVLSQSAQLTVVQPNRPPVADLQSVSLSEDSPLAITLTGSDPDGDTLTFTVLTSPSHGSLSGTAPDLVYSPEPNYNGPDSFTFNVSDGALESESATVSITVTPVNDPPVPNASAGPSVEFLATNRTFVIIASDDASAAVVLDGSLSFDIDNDPLQFFWVQRGSSDPFATGVVATNVFAVGSYTIDLLVFDGSITVTDTITVEVITPCEAIGGIIEVIENSSLSAKNKRPLVMCLALACNAFEHGQPDRGVNYLINFQSKVRSQVTPIDPALADRLVEDAQEIIDAF